jgi:signal transduction histidine kinase/ligand-binding sensor domain-containing protein
VATYKNGLVVIDNNLYRQFKMEDGLSSNDLNTLLLAHDNTLYVGTTLGLNLLKGNALSGEPNFDNVEINKMIEDGYGTIWVATEMGLGRFNNLYHTREFFKTDDGLPTRQISDLFFDHEGNLWLSTKKGGILRLKHSNFINYSVLDGLALDQVNIIEEKEPGVFYVGSDDGALNIISNGKISDYPIKTNLNQNGIRDICIVDDDEIWIGSYAGVLIKKGKYEKLLTRDNGLPGHDIRRIRKDSRGNIWVATRTAGIMKFRNDTLVENYDKDNGLKANYVLSVREDRQQNIWVGTNGGGLSRIDVNGGIETFSINTDPSGILFFNITVDQENVKWLATNVGIFRYDDQKFLEIILSSTSQNDTFFDIIFDDEDGIWVTSNIGLYRIRKQDVYDFVEGKLEAVPTTVFDHNDGLNNKECTGATRSLKSVNGTLWIPTLGGVATIDPSNVRENRIIPPVYVTDFLTDHSGEFISEALTNGSLILEPGNFRYRIKFTALSFQAPDKVRFRYKLDNIDEEWIENVNIREAHYTNLPPGRYTFRVMASNNDNYWNEEGASFSFRIKPYMYQRAEIYVIGMFVLMSFVWLGYKKRVHSVEKRNRELQKVNEELDKFVYSASHDLKAPLNSVLGLINIAKKEGASGNMHLYLELVEKSIRRLERFISDIIDYSRNASVSIKVSRVDFEEIVNEGLEEIKYLDEKTEIRKEVSVKGDGDFYSDDRRISVILNNLLSNAIKYHDKRKNNKFIKILVNYTPSKAEIIVEDNGLGINEEHQKKIFNMFYRANEESKGSGLGLYIVKETLIKIQGEVLLTSKPREGSRFLITLPSLKLKVK